jgi:transposase
MPKPIVPEELWQLFARVLPPAKNRHVLHAGRRASRPRQILSGIVFALKTGVPWEHLPATSDFPSGHTCLRWLKRWQEAGVWDRLLQSLLDELQREKKIDWRTVIVDSASVRAPHGGPKTGPSPVDRRKLGSKHHVVIDAQGVPLAVILTQANRNDITQLLPLLEKLPKVQGQKGRPKSKPGQVLGDRGYDSEPHRRAIKKRGLNRF